MKTYRAEVITAEESTWPKECGPYVVTIYTLENEEATGQSWGVFQGHREDCHSLQVELNKGFQFLEKN